MKKTIFIRGVINSRLSLEASEFAETKNRFSEFHFCESFLFEKFPVYGVQSLETFRKIINRAIER